MNTDTEVVELWKLLNLDVLKKVDSYHSMDIILPMYFEIIEREDDPKEASGLLELIVLMRTLMLKPIIISGNYKSKTMFEDSARDFFNSFVKNVDSRGHGKKLIQDIFCNYIHIIPNCPQQYKKEPIEFIKALANTLLNTSFTFPTTFCLDFDFYEKVCKSHELYADICICSPRLAFYMAEIRPLFPTTSLNGIALETQSFLPHFFSYQTISTPFWLNHQLQYEPNPFKEDDDKSTALLNIQTQSMERIHQSQYEIMLCYMLSSYISRDYILNWIAAVIDANISRRANPLGNVSSDGLMMNITLCLLDLLRVYIHKGPNEEMTKKFFMYICSDLCRVNYIRGNLPLEAEDKECIYNILNWLRPINFLSRDHHEKTNEIWWNVIRATPSELNEMIDAGLDCKPCSSLPSFLHSISHITDSMLFNSSILALKSYYDYSYNYFITGRRTSPVRPPSNIVIFCSACKKQIKDIPCYRCICCEHYFLCQSCFNKEKEEVTRQYRYPYSAEVIRMFQHPESISQLDIIHNPLTHLFTEIYSSHMILSERPVFHPSPSYPPLCPEPYEQIKQQLQKNYDQQPEEFSKAYTEAIHQITLAKEDKNYEYYDKNHTAVLDQYKDTLCTCNINGLSPCKRHGPLARRALCMRHEVNDFEQGFIHHNECYQCKTKPIIGTVYHCLQCSLELCSACYHREIEQGKGHPSHQCNHVFIMIYHPISTTCFYDHNRNDMRTIPNSVELLSNSTTISGVILDQFALDDDDMQANQLNLAVEIMALLIQLMHVNMTGLFQEYQLFVDISRLSLHRQLRDIQFNVNNMTSLYLPFMEHLSYSLLSLVRFFVSSECPLSPDWHFDLYCVDFNYIPMVSTTYEEEDHSKLKDTIILDINPCPMFNVLSSSYLEVISLLFRWYVQSNTVLTVKEEILQGHLDYTLLLLVICLNENLIPNITTRFDILETLFYLCTISKEKNDIVFLFKYPVIRHFLMIFCQRALIDSSNFNETQRALSVQLHANKIMILLLRSKSCNNAGYLEHIQLLSGLGISEQLFTLYCEDVIRQASNQQDQLNDIYARIMSQTPENMAILPQLKMTGQLYLENIKTVINLFVRIINCEATLKIIMSNYIMKRTTRFILVVLTSIAKPLYRDNPEEAHKMIRMNFNQWLNVIIDQILLLITHAPTVDTLRDEELPSAAVALDPSTMYRNSVIISFVEDDGFFDISVFDWAYSYCKANDVLTSKKLSLFEQDVNQLHAYQDHFMELNKVLDDCPEEFFDSLMDTVMQDPVILPSQNRCDRSTIIRQLSISPIDPFTRSPLTLDMIQPDEELKDKIHEYMKEKMNELRNPHTN